MKILIAIVHYWNPAGGGDHQSLRQDPNPRIRALQEQLLCLRRLGTNHSVLHMQDKAVYRINEAFSNSIDIKIVTDGEHHVLDYLHQSFLNTFEHVVSEPSERRLLGFEAHKILASYADDPYDLYCYLEDDLLIHDSLFFEKITSIASIFGDKFLLLPQRYETTGIPGVVDRFYIDGPIDKSELTKLVPSDGPVRLLKWGTSSIPFSPPDNPHAGCFFLTNSQLKFWIKKDWWLDFDVSFITPLESAATLGIAKTFNLLKPCFSHASWLDIQHYGDSFHSLISNKPK